MRRLLPLFLCVAATGLTACDDQPVSGPTNDDEQALYDFRKAGQGNGNGNPFLANGDVSLSREGGGGGIIIDFDIVDTAAYDRNGTQIQQLSNDAISSPDGAVLCTRTSANGFVQLRDADGDVLLSTIGPFVFDGEVELGGQNPLQQFQTLMSQLRFSYDLDTVIEGLANSGDEMVHASAHIQFSSGWRKLQIAALVDGYCGSNGLEDM
ncbi:hypothetical protein [Paraliomyxa miuraensis]|uniref:hypothetical protein n=1 Tax=Paraliomyxa miuraensis TaxID=376150 RepID=UPI0022528C9D|nr:hypothetical protein [Paraliomyxa miuraensis]MCX4244475.1 hypothetical protein [Paraliomyxa miuraensis]